jgi:hypothetical protein
LPEPTGPPMPMRGGRDMRFFNHKDTKSTKKTLPVLASCPLRLCG